MLLDQQQVAFQLVEQAVARADRENTKTVVIVLGGPGSGKSVIALQLLCGELYRQGRTGTARDGIAVLHHDHAQGGRGPQTRKSSPSSSTSTVS